jgi:methyl-accepting chemotaxis protein
MRRTNLLVKLVTFFLLVMGVFNVLYVWEFSIRMNEIVNTITNLGADVASVSGNMIHLTGTMEKFDTHMGNMPSISNATLSMSEQMPQMNQSMGNMLGTMGNLNREMSVMSRDTASINQHFGNITQGIGVMGGNVNEMSGPMGAFNSFMP